MGPKLREQLGRLVDDAAARLRRRVDWFVMTVNPNLSLGLKLAAPVMVVTAAVTGLLGMMTISVVSAQIEGGFDRESDVMAVGVQAAFASNPNDTRYLDQYMARVLETEPDIISIRIHGLDNGAPVIASSDPAEVGQKGLLDADELRAIWSGTARDDHEVTAAGPTLQTVRPLRVGDLLFGAVVINKSMAGEQTLLKLLSVLIGGVALGAILIEATFILGVLHFGVLRGAQRLEKAVRAVEAGDTSIRLQEGSEPPGRDEMFNLARQVDHMIAKLDERHHADEVIRRLGQRALQGGTTSQLVGEGLTATREALGLERCYFASVDEMGSVTYSIDDVGQERRHFELPVWIGALIRVSVNARKPVLTDRYGQDSHFAALGDQRDAQAAIIPLPRTNGSGEAIVAITPPGTPIPGSAMAMLEVLAATIAESLQRRLAEDAHNESESKSKVMAAVSHEMRNPLNSILGFTGLVLSSSAEPLTDKQRRHLGFVQTSATNMLGLVNGYLDLAKTRAGSLPLQLETVPMAPVVEEVSTLMQPIAAAKHIAIQTSVAAGAEARADAVRLRQVLTNLLSNAVKFTPDGGRVFVRARADRDSIRLVVSDTGVGIPKEQRGLVFTEFAKIDAGALPASKGTGLGLALTKGFVEAMGGRIRFLSRRGRGTTFVVKLPRPAVSEMPTRSVA